MLQDLKRRIRKENTLMVWITWDTNEIVNQELEAEEYFFVKNQAFPLRKKEKVNREQLNMYDGKVLTFKSSDETIPVFIGPQHNRKVRKQFVLLMEQSKSNRNKLIEKYANYNNTVISLEVKHKRYKRVLNRTSKLYEHGRINNYKENQKTGEVEVIFKGKYNLYHYVFGLNYIIRITEVASKKREEIVAEFVPKGQTIWHIRNKMALTEIGEEFNKILASYDLRKK